ncbi:hypothetical protein BSR28_01710 [Boudabousia liubingyangii]|uniref:arginase family protein n=1 Tax=Boudabousia liubingyangii TaxID=1921764 RepID=UPI00093A69EB|nr:arginase family protein [Boudabousia liubingyangii]OKL48444.1 hypothetical protein BSR28_01710 [Boudabousia liubingyangii]
MSDHQNNQPAEHVAPEVKIFSSGLRLGTGRTGDSGAANAVLSGGMDRLLATRLQVKALDYTPVELPHVTEDQIHQDHPRLKYLEPIRQHDFKLKDGVFNALQEGKIPFTIGGDHAIAIGTLAGVLEHCASEGKQVFALWFDAHTDINTPSGSESGNVHGVPLAVAQGHTEGLFEDFYPSQHFVQGPHSAFVGVRSIDPPEEELAQQAGMHLFRASRLKEIGPEWPVQIAEEVSELYRNSGASHFHFSFDLDGVDPSVAPSVFTDVPGGPSLAQALRFVEELMARVRVDSMDFVEFDPALDNAAGDGLRAAQMVVSKLVEGLRK